MKAYFFKEPTRTLAEFVRRVGIPVLGGELPDDTFLPGLEVVAGSLVIDEKKLMHPGDILHEAGHLAVMPAEERARSNGEVETAAGWPEVVELEAICWSYAACVELGIDPRIVFHEHGYQGRSEALLRGFELGVFPGVPGLELYGMTYTAPKAAAADIDPFPVMQRWLR